MDFEKSYFDIDFQSVIISLRQAGGKYTYYVEI